MKLRKNMPVVLVDILLFATAFTLSFLIRFDFNLPAGMHDVYWQGLCVILLVKPVVFCSLGFYRNLWQYASLQDAVKIIKVASISSLVTVFVFAFTRHFDPLPRSVIALDWVLLIFLVSMSRLGWRVCREFFRVSEDGKKRALIIGAGQAGSLLLKEIRTQAGSGYNVVGIVDDDVSKQGMLLNGVPVVGKQEHLPALVAKYEVEEIIIAIPSAKGKVLRNIIERCNKAGVRCSILPRVSDLIDGKISVAQIKDVEVDDLLGRETVVLDESAIRDYLTGKKVLISGAAGSIGSEICRQVAKFKPEKLILLDNAETPLFYIERELRAEYPDLRIIPIIGDVKNKDRIEQVFNEFRPEAVFHAAAYKHVQMMEYNPAEAVLNNIAGTKVMADAAHRYAIRDFVLISTDKAVNPSNVMGTTKRVAEIYVQALSRKSITRFTTVRFGNVIGSNGSVIPLFMEQIKKGGPVTVTDPNVVRYFMTIPEAAQLVLQAGCLGKGGEIFVLDMGEPVRIRDLAEGLIRLSGLVPYEEIDIVFTGLCPGEKLFEELLIAGEGIMPTTHEKIRITSAVQADLREVTAELTHLFRLADAADIAGMMQSLHKLVIEFTPLYATTGPASEAFQQARPDLYPRTRAITIPGKVLPMRNNHADRGLSA